MSTLETALQDFVNELSPVISAKLYAELCISIRIGPRGQEKTIGDPTLAKGLVPAALGNLAADLESRLRSFKEHPHGTLRLSVYEPGSSARPLLTFARSIRGSDAADVEGDPDIALLRQEVTALRAELRASHTLITHRAASDGATIGAQAKALAELATMRAGAGAASEFGGLQTLFGVGVMLVLAPMIKEALGLAPDATLADMVKAAKLASRGFRVALTQDAPRPALPGQSRSSVRYRLGMYDTAETQFSRHHEPESAQRTPDPGPSESDLESLFTALKPVLAERKDLALSLLSELPPDVQERAMKLLQ